VGGSDSSVPHEVTSRAPRHVSRLVPTGPEVRIDVAAGAGEPAVRQQVHGDPEALGRLLAAVEVVRADMDAVIVTDADREAVRFLAVLAVLEGRAPMPDYDLADPSLKWHAPVGVDAVPNAPTIITSPGGGPVVEERTS